METLMREIFFKKRDYELEGMRFGRVWKLKVDEGSILLN